MFKQLRKPGRSGMSPFKKVFAVVVFGLICLVFVFLDIGPGQFGGATAQGGAAAIVNSKVISAGEYRMRVRALEEQFGNNFGSLPAAQRQMFNRNIRERALEELINFEVLSQSAQNIGVMATDEAIGRSIMNIPSFQEDGRFRRERYDLYLQSTGTTAGDFESRVANEVVFTRVRDIFSKSLKGNSLLDDRTENLKNTKVNVEYVQFTDEGLKGKLKVSAARIKDFTDKEAEKIKTYYEGNKDEFTSKAEARARHILIKINTAKKDDDKRALAQIEKIQEELKTGDFGELAAKYSEDPGTKAKKGDLGFFPKGRMAPEFEDVAFSLPVGKVSGPVKTNFGYHLIKVEERRGGELSPLEKETDNIAKQLLQDEVLKSAVDGLREDLKEGRAGKVSGFIKDNQLKWEETGEFEMNRSFIPKLGDKESLLRLALEGQPGVIAPRLEQQGSQYYIVKLKSLKKEKPKADEASPLEVSNEANEAFTQWATEAKKEFDITRNASLINGGR